MTARVQAAKAEIAELETQVADQEIEIEAISDAVLSAGLICDSGLKSETSCFIECPGTDCLISGVTDGVRYMRSVMDGAPRKEIDTFWNPPLPPIEESRD